MAPRVGRKEKNIKMIKFRSIIFNADKSGDDLTSANDLRITSLGCFVRKYKIDRLLNFFNIFLLKRFILLAFIGSLFSQQIPPNDPLYKLFRQNILETHDLNIVKTC